MARRRKLTVETIRRIIKEEKARLNETLEMGLSHPSEVSKRTKEVGADKLADTLEACINHYKACNLKEAKLRRQLKKIQETKRRLKRKMKKNLG
tara:strand:+ start:157 stop:438 length:282 start_codon:yes stop_codon:yes gene_type:complete